MAELLMFLKRPAVWNKFRQIGLLPVPNQVMTAEEAWQKGLKTGYGKGLVDGVELGIDVVSEAGTRYIETV